MNRHDYRAHVAWSDSIRAERARPLPEPPTASVRVRHANRARAAVTASRAPGRFAAVAVAVLAVLL